ncbi:SMP-30/gluconolactonase/LRE family protein [Aureimonas sp. AU22]|uniref:SMP-30/gluconolactonase/LRE family protein n=1 Tax=Aureimonas sp. AU22 TaxID=1638162 RepID=UPI000781D88C|nr:SMP-30/gluconolactonase/LRE family protein [Aureimonas sp. AU22]
MQTLTPARFADGFMFLEAPKWRDGRLFVSDVFAHEICILSDHGVVERRIPVPTRPSGLGFLSDGTLIVASAKDCRLLRLDGDELAEHADLSDVANGWLNDFAIDRHDRIYVGDFGYDFVAGDPRRTTSLHRVDPDGTIEAVAHEVDFPNGSTIVDDGRTLVVAETWEARIAAFDLDGSGRLANRRLFADLDGRQPDGLCADRDGALWVGIYNTGEFVRVIDGGEITHRIKIDGSGISCTLGGPDRRTLFMTAFLGTDEDMSAGKRNSAILTAHVDVPGPSDTVP